MVSRIGPKEYRMFSCVVRYGYKDAHKNENDFETQLVLNIAKFIQRSQGDMEQFSREDRMIALIDENRAHREQSQHRHHPLPIKLEQDINVSASSFSMSCGDLVVCSRCEVPHVCSSIGLSIKQMVPEGMNGSRHEVVMKDELKELMDAKVAGVAYILGHSHMKARSTSSWVKKFAINFAFNFLKRNCRGPYVALSIPHSNLIEVGMVYHI